MRPAVAAVLAGCMLWAGAACHGSAGRAALPFGAVDMPMARQSVSGKFTVAGWALADDGVEAVTVYIDREFASQCRMGIARPDVARAYRGAAASGAAGWSVELESGPLRPGWHEVTVQARSKRGATRDLGSVPIVVRGP